MVHSVVNILAKASGWIFRKWKVGGRVFSGLCGEQMTIHVNLLDELERRCQDVLSAIEDVRETELWGCGNYYSGTRACGKLKRETLRLNEIGVKIRRGDRG